MKTLLKVTIALTTIGLVIRANAEVVRINDKLLNFTAVNRGEHNYLLNKFTNLEEDKGDNFQE